MRTWMCGRVRSASGWVVWIRGNTQNAVQQTPCRFLPPHPTPPNLPAQPPPMRLQTHHGAERRLRVPQARGREAVDLLDGARQLRRDAGQLGGDLAGVDGGHDGMGVVMGVGLRSWWVGVCDGGGRARGPSLPHSLTRALYSNARPCHRRTHTHLLRARVEAVPLLRVGVHQPPLCAKQTLRLGLDGGEGVVDLLSVIDD